MTFQPKNLQTRGIVLMLLSIVFFAANTLAIRGLVEWFSNVTGWHAVIYRGVAGLVVVITVGFLGLGVFFIESGTNQDASLFDALALLVAVMSAGVIVLIRKLHQTEHGSTIYGSQAFYGLLFTIPVSGESTLLLSATATGLLLIAGFVVAWGQLTMTFAYRHLDVSTGFSLQMILPVVTALGSCLLFGERFGMIEIIGATITLGATWMINRQASQKPLPVSTIHPKNS